MDGKFNYNVGAGMNGGFDYNNDPGYNGGTGYNACSGMTDNTGRPLKHHYGLKLTFSILEILSCCLLNPITMILGIISIIFTCGADSSFHQNRKEEFLHKARTATALLISGLVLDIAAVIIWGVIIMGASNRLLEITGADSMGELYNDLEEFEDWLWNGTEEEFWSMMYDAYSDGDYEDYFSDEYYYDGEYSYEYEYSDPDTLGEYWRFSINGTEIALPLAFLEFQELGFMTDLGDSVSTYTLDAYESYYAVLMDETGAEEIGYIQIYNPNDSTILIEEGIVIYVELYNPDVYCNNEVNLSIEMRDGISFGSTEEDMIAVFGETSMTTEEDEFIYMEWCLEQDEYNDFVYVELYNGEVSIIAVGYAGDYVIAEE